MGKQKQVELSVTSITNTINFAHVVILSNVLNKNYVYVNAHGRLVIID